MLIIDFEKGEKVVLDKFSKGTIPERGEFLDIGKKKGFFIVLYCPDYEQILLYDPESGKRERIKVTFISQLKYCAVMEERTRVFFYVEDYGKYVRNIIGESAFVEQNNHRYLTILKDLLM